MKERIRIFIKTISLLYAIIFGIISFGIIFGIIKSPSQLNWGTSDWLFLIFAICFSLYKCTKNIKSK